MTEREKQVYFSERDRLGFSKHYEIELWEPKGTPDREGSQYTISSEQPVASLEEATDLLLEQVPTVKHHLTISHGGDARNGLIPTTFRRIA